MTRAEVIAAAHGALRAARLARRSGWPRSARSFLTDARHFRRLAAHMRPGDAVTL